MKIAAFLTFGQFFFFCILGLSSVKRLSLYGNMISGTSQLKSLNSSAKKNMCNYLLLWLYKNLCVVRLVTHWCLILQRQSLLWYISSSRDFLNSVEQSILDNLFALEEIMCVRVCVCVTGCHLIQTTSMTQLNMWSHMSKSWKFIPQHISYRNSTRY